jgi:hypothetical protein
MRNALRFFAILSVVVVALYFFVANFSVVESRYKSKGELKTGTQSLQKTIYLKLEIYRPWVGLWSEWDADLILEAPGEWVEQFFYIKKVGDHFQIFDAQKLLIGDFSTLSKALSLKTKAGFFDGMSVETNDE